MTNKKVVKKAVAYCAGIAVALGTVYAIFVAVLKIPGACITEEMRTIPNLSGMKFEVTYTNCDTIAKDEAVRVYVSRAAVPGESLLARWSNRKTLLFRYDPERYDSPLPSIVVPSNDRILISIPEVSSVSLKNRKWRNVSIDYNIGHIDYP
jgi:hypothetical protein